jgi:energy-converting hydrogenase A subunit D
MNEIVMIASVILILSGMTAAILNRDPFDKLISLSVLIAGVFPFIVDRGFLDIAIATALIAPLSTIFTLMVCRRVQV